MELDIEGVVSGLVKLFPEEEKARVGEEARYLLSLYQGQEINTIGVLYGAAEKQRFDEFARKLKDYHEKTGKDVPIDDRALPIGVDVRVLERIVSPRGMKNPNFPPQLQNLQKHPEAVRMEIFFWNCYQELI